MPWEEYRYQFTMLQWIAKFSAKQKYFIGLKKFDKFIIICVATYNMNIFFLQLIAAV